MEKDVIQWYNNLFNTGRDVLPLSEQNEFYLPDSLEMDRTVKVRSHCLEITVLYTGDIENKAAATPYQALHSKFRDDPNIREFEQINAPYHRQLMAGVKIESQENLFKKINELNLTKSANFPPEVMYD